MQLHAAVAPEKGPLSGGVAAAVAKVVAAAAAAEAAERWGWVASATDCCVTAPVKGEVAARVQVRVAEGPLWGGKLAGASLPASAMALEKAVWVAAVPPAQVALGVETAAAAAELWAAAATKGVTEVAAAEMGQAMVALSLASAHRRHLHRCRHPAAAGGTG